MNFKNLLIKLLVWSLKPRLANAAEEKRFLILSTTGLGDTLWGTPAIRSLRESFPSSYIALLTSGTGNALLKHNPHINAIFVAKDPLFFQLFSLYRKLKTQKFTHVLSFHTSQRPVLPLSAILGAQEIIGTRGINKGLDFLLTRPLSNFPTHEIQRRLDIISEVGAHASDFSMELFLSPDDEKAADIFLQAARFPRIAIHPGAKDGFKQWPPSHFIKLGNKLVQTLNCQIIITGTPSEKELVESIASQIQGAIPATHLPLLATAALIKRTDLLIANDTGPMHLGFAQKTPTLGIFTPTDPKLCGPYFVPSALAIARKPTCTPCLRKKCKEPFCLLQIGVDEIYNSALDLLHLNT